MSAPVFARYIGIDYSGAQTPTSRLKSLRAYRADRASSPLEVQPPSPRKCWTRRGVVQRGDGHGEEDNEERVAAS